MFTIESIIYIFKIQSYIMYAQARMRVYACFSLVPSNLCCHSETAEGWQETSTYKFHPSYYVLSCPCNKETPKTSKPLREGDNQTEQFNHTSHAGGGGSSDSASDHLEQPLYKYQQGSQQKAHSQLLTLPWQQTHTLHGNTLSLTSSSR
jgi:hypothetical protein